MTTLQPFLLRLVRWLPPMLLQEPWALFVKIACVLSGASYLLQLSSPGAISRLLPPAVVALWNADLLLGGALGLAGLLRKVRRVEIAGLCLLGASTLVYATVILAIGGRRGIVAALLIGLLGAAAYLRALGLWATGATIRQRVTGPE
jgi:hypothetical protein